MNKVKSLKLVLEDKEKLILDFKNLLAKEKSQKNANVEELKNFKIDLKNVKSDYETTLAAFDRQSVFLQESKVNCEGQARAIEKLEKNGIRLEGVESGLIDAQAENVGLRREVKAESETAGLNGEQENEDLVRELVVKKAEIEGLKSSVTELALIITGKDQKVSEMTSNFDLIREES
jgi:folate-binding Fe-S cluster repair protein YgfZ